MNRAAPAPVAAPLRDPIALSVYSGWDRLEEFRPAWNRLVARSPVKSIFLTYDFLRAWAASNTRECRPRVILAFHGPELAGIAPLMYSVRNIAGLRLRTLEFLGTPASDYADFIYEDDGVLPVLWDGVRGLLGEADLLYLQAITENSPTAEFLQRNGCAQRKSEICCSAAVPQEANARPESILKQPGFRPRAIRRLEKEGVLKLEFYREFEEIRERLPVLYDQHIRRWQELGKPSPFLNPAFKSLHENVSRSLCATDNAVLVLMTLDGKPIVSLWGFIYAQTLALYTVAFDVAYRRFSAGLVFFVKLFQSAGRLGVERIDFGRGAQGFKTYFADRQLVNREFLLFRTLKARILMKSFLTARDWVMSHQAVKNFIRRLGYRGDTTAPPAE